MTYVGQQLTSEVTSGGKLRMALQEVDAGEPQSNEVVVRVEASPINPSDLGLLFGLADMTTAVVQSDGSVSADVSEKILPNLSARFDEALPVGNEGAGVVVAAGDSPEAQALVGKTVAILGGAMYSQYRRLKVKQCLVLPDGVTPAQGASCFVNPLTALGMTETMRLENHSALLHTAAASNLGQMLQKICIADGISLVNVVRREEQVQLLRDIGAEYVVNSSAPTFKEDLVNALVATGATIAFDATGGGQLGGQILTAMEAAANRTAKEYSRYGSDTFKQLYIYGGLDRSPTTLNRNFGFSWSVGGWLLTPFLQKIGPQAAEDMRQRVAREITTTFASSYTAEVSLAEALTLEAIAVYGKQATGEKYLINPAKG